MKVIRFLIPLFFLLLLTGQALCAVNGGQAPLQLVPGPGSPPPPALQQGGQSMGEQVQLRDIHPPLPLPEEANYTLLVAGVILFLLLLAAVVWFFRGRRKKVHLPFAHDTALADLVAARSLMTPEQGLQYAKRLSDILRSYIEARFRIHTTRQTTKEFFVSLAENPGRAAMGLEAHSDSLHECLDHCDLAKFARCTPDRNGMEQMERAVQDFIESTRENREGAR